MLHVSYAVGMVQHTMNETTATKLAQSIRAARGETSQQVFATRIGTNILTLRAWEKARTTPKLYRHIEALKAAGVPMTLLRAGAARKVAA